MIRVEAKRYDTTPASRRADRWRPMRCGFTRHPAGWLLLVSARSLIHPLHRAWFITVEPV